MPLVTCPVCQNDDIDVVEDMGDGRRRLRCDSGHVWIIGTARPDPATGEMLQVFQSHDAPYLAWLEAWPDGYVLNCLRSRNPNDLTLHRGRCWAISTLQPGKTTFTGGEYIKVCSTDRHKVRQWALKNCGAYPSSCQLCM